MSLFRWICLTPRGLVPATVEQVTALQRAAPHPASPQPAASQRKFVPVIETDACIGCERCIAACDHGCLEMIWSFSTLTRPQQCQGEGHCVEACPEQIIHMEWVVLHDESAAVPLNQLTR
jgi:NAD-dependent dihydropyrimidine dehydrogenase PreA subunit